jgi:hypothetical protein
MCVCAQTCVSCVSEWGGDGAFLTLIITLITLIALSFLQLFFYVTNSRVAGAAIARRIREAGWHKWNDSHRQPQTPQIATPAPALLLASFVLCLAQSRYLSTPNFGRILQRATPTCSTVLSGARRPLALPSQSLKPMTRLPPRLPVVPMLPLICLLQYPLRHPLLCPHVRQLPARTTSSPL